jgi:hypothetical protein
MGNCEHRYSTVILCSNNSDAFVPFDRTDLSVNGTLEYGSTDYYPSFYGPDVGPGTQHN